MFNHVCVVIVTLLLIQQICHSNAKTITTTNKEQVKASLHDGEHTNPTTSYYRHNIYGPNTYAFGFEVNDKASGNIQFRDERRYANGSTEGSYGYVRPDGSVMVTHFMADAEQGYLSQTQNFEPGDEPKWLENWPTKKPTIIMEKPSESIKPMVVYDDKEKLNLTSILLPVEPIKEEHGLDLNPPKLEKELVNPAVLEVINGEAPLVGNDGKKDDGIGFETINKFIPPQFPTIPIFELPQEEKPQKDDKQKDDEKKDNEKKDEKQKGDNKELKNSDKPQIPQKYNDQKINNSEKVLPILENLPSSAEKYIKSKENNNEKSLPADTLRTSSTKDDHDENFAKAKSLSLDDNISWYDKIIKQTRQEYLESLKKFY